MAAISQLGSVLLLPAQGGVQVELAGQELPGAA